VNAEPIIEPGKSDIIERHVQIDPGRVTIDGEGR
jgi:hypothetical protein